MRGRAAVVGLSAVLLGCSDDSPTETYPRVPVVRSLVGLTEAEVEPLAQAALEGEAFQEIVEGVTLTTTVGGPAFDGDRLIGWSFQMTAVPPIAGHLVWPSTQCIDDQLVLMDQPVDVARLEGLSVLVDAEHDEVIGIYPLPPGVGGLPARFDPDGEPTGHRLLGRPCDSDAANRSE